jgi:DNA-binding NarL/FixJ family response regulator
MIFTQKQMAAATTRYESRFRFSYLSLDFDPTIVFACSSEFLLASLYRGMPIKRHFLGAATTAFSALELISRFSPNFFAISDDLPDLGVDKLVSQARQIHPQIRPSVYVGNLNSFFGFSDCPIVVAESDILTCPDSMGLSAMAMLTNTSYLSPSIESRLYELNQNPPDFYPGTISLTPREHQLLEAYALGLSNADTAQRLGLSVRSVQTYSGNLLQKLGTNNRQRAIKRAISMGFTELIHLFDR